MITKNRIKFIHRLERRKERKELQLFVAEGPKLVGELLRNQQPVYIACLSEWHQVHSAKIAQTTLTDIVTEDELRKASFLQHPQEVLAIFPTSITHATLSEVASQELVLALDGVQDPGNLGTIVRLADWFGIRHVFCSAECADIYNPKAVQATMGALAHVGVHSIDLPAVLRTFHGNIYGTHLHGTNIYHETLHQTGVIVMGNEGKGITKEVEELVTKRLLIPPYPANSTTVESLNVAMATAIVCAEFRRRGQ